MGKIGENFGVEHNKSQKQIRGDRGSKDEGHKSSFCLTDGHLLFKECRIGDKAPKIQRSSCTPRRCCERRFWIWCSIHWTRIISTTNDSSKSHAQQWRRGWHNNEEPVVTLERNLYGHPLADPFWEHQPGSVGPSPQNDFFSPAYVDDTKMAGKKHNQELWGRTWWNTLIWRNQRRFLIKCTWDALDVNVSRTKKTVYEFRNMFESRISAWATGRFPDLGQGNEQVTAWSCDMQGHAEKCVEGYCDWANKSIVQLYRVCTFCIDDHLLKHEELETLGYLSKVRSQIDLSCLYLARMGGPVVCKHICTSDSDRRLARLISYIRNDRFQAILSRGKHVLKIADWIVPRLRFFLPDTFEDSTSTSAAFYVSLEVERSYQSVRCARSRRQSHKVRQCPKSYLWSPVCVFTVSLLLFFAIEQTDVAKQLRCTREPTGVWWTKICQLIIWSHTFRDDCNGPNWFVQITNPNQPCAFLCRASSLGFVFSW